MRLTIDDIKWCYFNPQILEMANMQPRDTGLHAIIHIMQKGKVSHGARVKVSNIAGTFHPDDNFTVTAEPEPRVIGKCKLKQEHLQAIIDWVKLNRSHINQVWHHGDIMSPTEVESGFRRI